MLYIISDETPQQELDEIYVQILEDYINYGIVSMFQKEKLN